MGLERVGLYARWVVSKQNLHEFVDAEGIGEGQGNLPHARACSKPCGSLPSWAMPD